MTCHPCLPLLIEVARQRIPAGVHSDSTCFVTWQNKGLAWQWTWVVVAALWYIRHDRLHANFFLACFSALLFFVCAFFFLACHGVNRWPFLPSSVWDSTVFLCGRLDMMRRRWADFGSDSEDDLWPMPPTLPRRVPRPRRRPPPRVRRAVPRPAAPQYFLAVVPRNVELQMCVINLFVEVACNGGPGYLLHGLQHLLRGNLPPTLVLPYWLWHLIHIVEFVWWVVRLACRCLPAPFLATASGELGVRSCFL